MLTHCTAFTPFMPHRLHIAVNKTTDPLTSGLTKRPASKVHPEENRLHFVTFFTNKPSIFILPQPILQFHEEEKKRHCRV